MTRSEGVDLSAHQEVTPPLTPYDFVFPRATYGTWFDDRYHQHVAAARVLGLIVGAYHFGTAASSGETQAHAFLAAAGAVDLYVLDWEKEKDLPQMPEASARAFIATVKATGKRCGLYHSLDGFPSLGQDWNWVAAWRATPPPPRIPWAFWQYHGGPLDLDRYNGDRVAMRTFAGHPPPPPPPVHVPKTLLYKVRTGDTLTRIARAWHVPGGWEAIYKLNRRRIGSNPNLIHAGQLLTLPEGSHK